MQSKGNKSGTFFGVICHLKSVNYNYMCLFSFKIKSRVSAFDNFISL